MYRVVIVDDEEPVLDSFAYILEREGDDFQLSGKARSGVEAVRVISDVKPDLVFMDIQMPGIDGIDAIRQIRAKYPDTVFVLATAYERFDIAQRAIPLGIFSYLVKPISRRALVDELHRVKLHLDRIGQRDRLQLQDIQVLRRTREDAKSRFLGGLAWRSPTAEEWEVFARLFSLRSDRGLIRLVETIGPLSEEAREAVFQELTEQIVYKLSCVHAIIAGRLAFFFPEDQSLERLDTFFDHASTGSAPVELRIGTGTSRHYSELDLSFSEALHSLDLPGGREVSFGAQREEVEAICAALRKSDFGRGVTRYEDYWMRTFRENELAVAKAKMVGLFTVLLSCIDTTVLQAAQVDFSPAEEIMPLSSVDAWREWSADMIDALRTLFQEQQTRSLPQHLAKAISIIRERFHQPIQLSSIAEECQITPSYLSRLFSEHLGTTFVEYLTRYRIDRSKELLRDERISVKETSGLVGFQDANYFSRIFRRYVGVSPSYFANRRTHNEI